MKDLHIHTKYSDGEYDEYEILEKITESNIKEFAICDHDTIEGCLKVHNILLTKKYNLKFHTGIELSCRVNNFMNGINLHLLVRDFDLESTVINSIIKKISDFRLKKLKIMLERINERFNFIPPKKDINEIIKQTNSIGKPHLYTILKKYTNISRDEYYKNMKHLDTNHLKLDTIEILNLMKNEKGYVTLAHPIEIMEDYNLTYTDIDNLVKHLKENGLDALETQHSKHTKENYLEFSKIAQKHNLLETQGSDYHGPNIKPNVKLGICEKL